MSNPAPIPPSAAHPSTADLYVGFFLAGMATTLLGPLVPVLSRQWALSDASVGLLFSTQFLSSVAVTMLSSTLVARFAATRVLIVGFLLLAIGIGTIGAAPWPAGLASTMCYGFGLGLVLPTTNVLVAAVNPGREAAAVSLVNVAWSAGAVSWPVIVARTAAPASVVVPTVALGIMMACLSGRLASVPRTTGAKGDETRDGDPAVVRSPARPAVDVDAAAADPRAAGARELASLAVAFGAVFFVYSGAESSVGGWVAEHVRRIDEGRAGARWAMAPTAFWGALTLGRLLTPALLRLATERVVLRSCAVGATLGTATLAAAGSGPMAFVAAAMAGFALAPIFPVAFGQMSRTLAPHRPRLVGPIYALTGVGAATLPWFVGICSTLTGSLRAGLLVPVAGAATLLAIIVFHRALRAATGTLASAEP